MLFTPRHIKEGKHYRQAVKRLLHYKQDILPPKEVEELQALMAKMSVALKRRQREQIYSVRDEIEKQVGRIAPPPPDSAWRENVEVFLVAIIVAAGVRAYFLQPFKIPTGSMQPTLYGVVATPTDTPPPNLLTRAIEFFWLGRTYVDVTATEDDKVVALEEKTYLNFFTFTDIIGEKSHYKVFVPADTLRSGFHVIEGVSEYHRGDAIARGYVDTGDQVFVDKVSYQFRAPHLGDVLVFETTGIWRIQRTLPPGMTQHYIKRLAGVPGTTLRIDSPNLYLDGQLASLPGFQRVMSMENGYQGYSNMQQAIILSTPEDTFTVPPHSFFALGDNSYHSSDSRFWGIVPGENVTGKGLFVYWPFGKRWGFIH